MHQYLETVRNEIEAAAGQEAYLTSSLFLRMYKAFQYEDEGSSKLANKEGYEKVQNQAVISMNTPQEFDLDTEILAWQGAILRNIARETYYWWVDYKEQRFMAEDCFSDGEPCIMIEASCENLGINPTEMFTELLEVEYLLTRLSTSCNKIILETSRYWQFKSDNRKKAPESLFMSKRIDNESKHTILYETIETLKGVSERCLENARALAGAGHLLWIHPHQRLESLIISLEGFIHFEHMENPELSLNSWVDTLFPSTLKNGDPNPNWHSTLHHNVIANLSQATQCLVQHTIHHIDSFTQRDSIVRPFILEILEKVKRAELVNLKAAFDEQQKNNLNTL